jgi:hypothetical protein
MRFDPATSIAPPAGRRRSWVHYGVMLPGLPPPERYFGVMAIVGTPGASFVANDDHIQTTPRDTAYLVSHRFHTYSVQRNCDFAPDGSRLRFGDDLLITGRHPSFEVTRTDPPASLLLDVTSAATRFVRIPGMYDHWSLLCHARGYVGATEVDTLCTFEYAHGVSMHSVLNRRLPKAMRLPVPFFTYHVLNVDHRMQLLFSDVRGPRGIPLQHAAHVRSVDGTSTMRRAGHRFEVQATTPHTTPDGRTMALPLAFTWAVDGIEIHGRTNDDFAYGLGAGYVGTYDYEGNVDGRAITGCAYLEYVDLR